MNTNTGQSAQSGCVGRTTIRVFSVTGLTNGVFYEVRCRARNLAGYGAWGPTVTVQPVADVLAPGFTYSVSNLVVQIFSTATGQNLSHEYDMGDGTIVSGQANPRHPYTSEGTYIVTQTVSDGTDTRSVSQSITVSNKPGTFVLMDFNKDNEFSHPLSNISGLVIDIEVERGMPEPGMTVADPGIMKIVMSDKEGVFSHDRGITPFNRANVIGMRVRVAYVTPSEAITIATMWVLDAQPGATKNAPKTTLYLTDLLAVLKDVDYYPDFDQGTLISDELANALRGRVYFPYISDFPLVGDAVVGKDRVNEIDFNLDRSNNFLDWVGDKGTTRVLAYIRELMMAEFGGRFFLRQRWQACVPESAT